ncbi:MAG: hypothetical protein B6U73_03600 [Desulfurococcales archaeon ex4484_204]|nr:MAG: hypothetical protein B6U73_03600 [Desulfurococcales archaeon ex4484_204]
MLSIEGCSVKLPRGNVGSDEDVITAIHDVIKDVIRGGRSPDLIIFTFRDGKYYERLNVHNILKTFFNIDCEFINVADVFSALKLIPIAERSGFERVLLFITQHDKVPRLASMLFSRQGRYKFIKFGSTSIPLALALTDKTDMNSLKALTSNLMEKLIISYAKELGLDKEGVSYLAGYVPSVRLLARIAKALNININTASVVNECINSDIKDLCLIVTLDKVLSRCSAGESVVLVLVNNSLTDALLGLIKCGT